MTWIMEAPFPAGQNCPICRNYGSCNVRIRFLGAADEVTGSCHLVETGGRRLLLDCGLIQGESGEEARNRAPFGFDPAGIDAVVLSHAHLDHAGRLPLLVKQGYRGPIYTHPATRDLCRIMLMDSAHLMEADAATDTRKRERRGLPPATPLYTPADVQACLHQVRNLPYGERRKLFPGIACRLRDAGHILGAAVVELWGEDGGVSRKLVFSGDLGHCGDLMMPPPQAVEEADFIIMESAYGDRLHRGVEATLEEFSGIVREATGGGNILIPAFAVGRTQEILYVLAQHARDWQLRDWRIFLDSPMAIEATQVYVAHSGLLAPEAARYAQRTRFLEPQVRFTATPEESMAINRVTRGAIIIAGSGMCSGGRIRHHLKHHLWRPQDHLVFIGFQAAGTLGREIVDGAREVNLWGEPVKVAAQVHTLGGFSAHADRNGLADWYGACRSRPPLALVHGEPAARAGLAAELHKRFGVTALLPKQGEALDLGAPPRWQQASA